jgi:DNA-binding beta-propeller fold protein YncE
MDLVVICREAGLRQSVNVEQLRQRVGVSNVRFSELLDVLSEDSARLNDLRRRYSFSFKHIDGDGRLVEVNSHQYIADYVHFPTLFLQSDRTRSNAVDIRPIEAAQRPQQSEPEVVMTLTDNESETIAEQHLRPSRLPLFNGIAVVVAVVALISTLVILHVRNIPIGTSIPNVQAPQAIALAANGNRLYVGSEYSTSPVIDTKTHAFISESHDLAVSSDGRLVYSPVAGKIRVIDAHSDKAIAAVPIPKSRYVAAMALSPDSSRLYVCEMGLQDPYHSIFKTVDLRGHAVSSDIHLNGNIDGMAVTPDGKLVYASSMVTGGMIYAIQRRTNKVVAKIPIAEVIGDYGPGRVGRILITPNGRHAYIDGRDISVIDLSKNAIIRRMPFHHPSVLSPDGRYIYTFSHSALVRVDAATGRVLGSVSDYIPASDITISSDGRKIYIANYRDNSISIVDSSDL